VALLVVGVLTLLIAGSALLGAFQAPTGADLAVHNGAGETLIADRVVGKFTASTLGNDVVYFVFTAPARTSVVVTGPRGAVKAKRTVSGGTAIGILQPVNTLLRLHHFSQHGSTYENVEPVSDLMPDYERASVSGLYRTTVQLAGGFVVAVHVQINAVEQGQPVAETIDFRLTRVGGWERS
jgi:hypothetical protein